jgi:hypothetical protein
MLYGRSASKTSKWRKLDNRITGSLHIIPSHERVAELMTAAIEQ